MSTKSARTKVILNVTSFILHIFLNILFYVVVILIVVNLSKAAYDFSYQIFGNVSVDTTPGRDVTIQIKKGESTMNIASKLEISKAITNKYSFYLKVKLTKQLIKPGTYVINSSMNYDEILAVITDLKMNQEKKTKVSSTKHILGEPIGSPLLLNNI